jgi:hypothetical protein
MRYCEQSEAVHLSRRFGPAGSTTPAQHNKSFLRAFFKKALLTCL